VLGPRRLPPVSVGGVRVEPGDVVVMDGDGAVVVPAGRAEEVLEAGRSREADEAAMGWAGPERECRRPPRCG
jgi:regulator of RNase E activity RraA